MLMPRHSVALALSGAGLLCLPLGACHREETSGPSCWEVYETGLADARASNPSCIECNYEETWNIDAYDTQVLQRCYANGFYDAYDYECLEMCQGLDTGSDSCCREAMDFVVEQIDALGLRDVTVGHLYRADPGTCGRR